MEKLG